MTRLPAFGPLALLLAACSLRPSTGQRPAPPISVRVEPSADQVFNIVWLRATIRNQGPRTLWVLNHVDSVFAKCSGHGSVALTGLSPAGRELFQCLDCPDDRAKLMHRYQPLKPGEELRTAYQVDLNRIFPRGGSAADTACRRFVNRTPGTYRLQLVTTLFDKARRPVVHDTSGVVAVLRKN